MMERTLEEILEAMRTDTTLPLTPATLVFGEGSAVSRVMFIGEAPGAEEDKQGRPFVGRGGQLLRKEIRRIGWKEENVYITNIVKRRPPENRDPTPEEIEAYRPYLKEQIRAINPELIVALGRFSMNYFLPEAKISRDQGKVFILLGKKIFPIFHPAAALRNPEMMRGFIGAFDKLPVALNSRTGNKDI